MPIELPREERLDALAQNAKDSLARSANCAQSAFDVLQEAFEMEGSGILKALTPFPGIALRGETCGAVVGCLMALGLAFGRDDLDDMEGFISALTPARRFCRRFEEEYGSTSCARILEAKLGRSFNLADPAEFSEYLKAGGGQVCEDMIAYAVQLAGEELMQSK